MLCYVNYLFHFLREMISEDLKLRKKAPKDLYGHDKTLPKVKKQNIIIHHMA